MIKAFTGFVLLIGLTGCGDKRAATASPAKPTAASSTGATTGTAGTAATATGPVEISVTENGFEPGKIQVAAGKPVTLVFTRKTDKTCAKEVVIETGDGQQIQKDLPLDQRVEVPVTFAKAGELKYGCAMGMFSGVIVVQ